jgi:hypothetical protein
MDRNGKFHDVAALPLGKNPVPLNMKLGVPQILSGRVWRKYLVLPGFEPRTVQPIASRYTDWMGFYYSLTKVNTGDYFKPKQPSP